MIKKTITYTDYNDNKVTEDFYFNFTALELIEKELTIGGLKDKIAELQETQDAETAYNLFKSFILEAYGEKTDDGRYFEKEDANGRPLWKKFASSPACSDMIVEFVMNPELGAQFIESTIPTKMVADAKAAQAAQDPKNVVALPSKETAKPEPTDEELLSMKPQDMTHEQLQRAFALKTQN